MRRFAARIEAALDAAAAAPRTLLLLDYDGTLAPVRRRPERARLGPRERALLARLNRGRTRVAVVSGRSVADLRARVGLADLSYVGAFGLQASAPGWRWLHPRARAARDALDALAARLRSMLAGVPGAAVENKSAAVCVHYRRVPRARRAALGRLLARARRDAPRGVRWREGQRAWEAVPAAAWDKGRAALMLWRRQGRPRLLAVGDDHFDEPMFRAARGRGTSARVGAGRTSADLRLKNPAEVARFLRAFAERVER